MNAFSIWNADSVSKMFDFLSLFPDFGHRTDIHFQMHVDEFGIHPSVHFLGFDSVRHQRHVGNKQQCTTLDIVCMTDNEQGCSFHVDADGGKPR